MTSHRQQKGPRGAGVAPQQKDVRPGGGPRVPLPGHPGRPRSAGRGRRAGWWAGLSIAVVVLAVATLVALALGSSSPPASSPTLTSGGGVSGPEAASAPVSVQAAVTSVSGRTLRSVGVPTDVAGPTKIAGGGTRLVGPDGKPEILFVGAEYCPYCAAERWALVVALSRFGSFTGLKATQSSLTDTYPGTQTLSFYGSTYTSSGLDFTPVEIATNQAVDGRYTTLQALTPGQQAVLDRYDRPPYTSQAGAIPFIDVANRSVMVGASYDPGVLQGRSIGEIASALSHPSSAIAQAIDGTANTLVAAISQATGVQPNP